MRRVSKADLLEMLGDGADIQRESNKVELLVGAIQDMIKAGQEAQEKNLKQVTNALSEIASKLNDKDIDVDGIKSLLANISENTAPKRPSYQFDVERNSRGLIKSVNVTPKESVH